MTDVMRAIAYVIITLLLGVLLKEFGFKGSKLVTLLGTVSVIAAAIMSVDKLSHLAPGLSDDSKKYAVSMMKMIGVGYAFGICSDMCADLGEASLSSAVCLLGRVEIIILTVPYIKMIIERGIEMI